MSQTVPRLLLQKPSHGDWAEITAICLMSAKPSRLTFPTNRYSITSVRPLQTGRLQPTRIFPVSHHLGNPWQGISTPAINAIFLPNIFPLQLDVIRGSVPLLIRFVNLGMRLLQLCPATSIMRCGFEFGGSTCSG